MIIAVIAVLIVLMLAAGVAISNQDKKESAIWEELRAYVKATKQEADEAHNELGGAAVRSSEAGVGTGEATID